MLCQPEVKVGIMPGAGGTQRLNRAVGKFKAMKMLLTGLPIAAEEASAMGLVSEVVADEEVLDRALELAEQHVRPCWRSPRSRKCSSPARMPLPETGLMLERKAFQLLFASRDQKEGMHAFLEKRDPQFTGE